MSESYQAKRNLVKTRNTSPYKAGDEWTASSGRNVVVRYCSGKVGITIGLFRQLVSRECFHRRVCKLHSIFTEWQDKRLDPGLFHYSFTDRGYHPTFPQRSCVEPESTTPHTDHKQASRA
jgi:hypothetical protein